MDARCWAKTSVNRSSLVPNQAYDWALFTPALAAMRSMRDPASPYRANSMVAAFKRRSLDARPSLGGADELRRPTWQLASWLDNRNLAIQETWGNVR